MRRTWTKYRRPRRFRRLSSKGDTPRRIEGGNLVYRDCCYHFLAFRLMSVAFVSVTFRSCGILWNFRMRGIFRNSKLKLLKKVGNCGKWMMPVQWSMVVMVTLEGMDVNWWLKLRRRRRSCWAWWSREKPNGHKPIARIFLS